MPANISILIKALVGQVTFTAEHRAMVRQSRAEVERRESSLFDTATVRRVQEQAAISICSPNKARFGCCASATISTPRTSLVGFFAGWNRRSRKQAKTFRIRSIYGVA